MPNTQFHTAISSPRFARYFTCCNNDPIRAKQLYIANSLLSEKMYSLIGMFEIILRNSIDRHFKIHSSPNWLEDAIADGGAFDINPGCEDSYHSIQDAIFKLDRKYDHDALVAKLTFGFWRYLFAPKEFAAMNSTLIQIFVKAPKGTRQKSIFQDLTRINDIRNRIAHYEPICFDSKTQTISTVLIRKRYSLIIDLLDWLGCNTNEVLKGIDRVEPYIKYLERV